jgi:HSP20 family protein
MSTLSVWTRRDPFSDFETLVRNAFRPALTGSGTVAFAPAAEVRRDGDDAVIRLELPGVDITKDVTVDVDRGQLVVRGERRDEWTGEDGKDGSRRSLREVRYGAFRRAFGLPAHVTAEAVSATYDAGVLSVRVTGAYAGDEPRRIAIASA